MIPITKLGSHPAARHPVGDRLLDWLVAKLISIDGTDISGLTIDGTDVSEVTIDGTTAWTAIPDSESDQKLDHRWILDDVNGTVDDSEGSATGTVNGVSSVDGDYAGGSAAQGDGIGDDISVSTDDISSFLGNLDSAHAVAFTIDLSSLPSSRQDPFGTFDSGAPFQNAKISADDAEGTFTYDIRDDNGNRGYIYSDGELSTGKTRVVLNAPSGSPSDWEIWFNQTEETTVPEGDTLQTGVSSDRDWTMFQRSDGDSYLEGILDDFCLFNDSLTSTEIQSYNNPWE